MDRNIDLCKIKELQVSFEVFQYYHMMAIMYM